MSVVGGDEVQRLDTAMESFADVAVASMDEIATEVARARAKSLEFVIGYGEQSQGLIDLGDFLRNLEGLPAEVEVARDAAFAAIEASVQSQVLGRATEQATGLNVLFPPNARVGEAYVESGTAPRGWGEFVTAFLEAGVESQSGGGVAFTDDEAEVVLADRTGIKVSAQLTSESVANVTASETQVLAAIGGQDRALAVALPAYVNAGGEGQVQGVWNYAITSLTDGRRTLPFSAGFQAQSGGFVGSALLQYTAPGGAVADVGLRMLLSSEGTIESVSLVDVTDGSAGGIEPEIGGTLTPYVFVPGSNGYQPVLSTQSIEVSKDLEVVFDKAQPGTPFDIGLVVVDVAGGVAEAFTSETVR